MYIIICTYSLLSKLMIHWQYCIRPLTSDFRNVHFNVHKHTNDSPEILYSILWDQR